MKCSNKISKTQRTAFSYCKPFTFSLALFCECQLGTYEINASIKSEREICGNKIDDNLDGQTDEGCECQVLNLIESIDPKSKFYVPPSKCVQGKKICIQDPMSQNYIWKEIFSVIDPTSPEIPCNFIDDDCDGQTDEDPQLGQDCYSMGTMTATCKMKGIYVCDYQSNKIVCSATNRPAADPQYYFSNPYVVKPAAALDLTPILDWDWDCDNASKIDTGFVNSTSISPTSYNTTKSSIIATASINQIQASAITSTPASLCSMNKATWCDSAGADKYNIVRSGTLPPSSTECGKSFMAIKCQPTCTAGSLEVVTVVCK